VSSQSGEAKKAILFDEAMAQTCGFGMYQYMLFVTMGFFNNYG